MPLGATGAALLGTSLTAGASTANSIFGQRTARRNTDKTIQANRQLAQYAYQKDRAMWHEANAYNSPQAQMERLKSAGLNPHLVYGSGSVVGNTSGSTPQYNAPKVDYQYQPLQLPVGVLGEYINTMLGAAQIDNVRAKEKQIEAETAKTLVEAGIKTDYRNYHMPYESGILSNRAQASNYLVPKAEQELIRSKLLNDIQNQRNVWEKKGLSPQDKLWFRMISKALPSMGISLDTLKKTLGTKLYNDLME